MGFGGLPNIGPKPKASDVITRLDLSPHPEGGHYRETYRHAPTDGRRGDATSIYFLLALGEVSTWHRVTDAVEIWHFQAGDPLVLTLSENGHDAQAFHLGPDVMAGQHGHVIVPAGAWQTAESLGDWTLCACTVAPAFSFEGFEMAAPDWRPTPRNHARSPG